MSDRHGDMMEHLKEWPVKNYACFVLDFSSGSVDIFGDHKSVFRWASVSKLGSALAILSAVSEGVATIDQDVAKGSLVSDLLAHASGLATDIDFSVDIFSQKPAAPARTRRIYSNTGFELLAASFEKMTGFRFKDYMSEVLFQPAKMESASVSGSLWPHAGESGSAAGILGSLEDLIGLANALYSGTPFVDIELLEMAKKPYLADLPGILPGFGSLSRNTWGLGFEIKGEKFPHWTAKSNSPSTYGHFGASGTFLWIDPTINLALGVLTDRDFGPWAQKRWPELSELVIESY